MKNLFLIISLFSIFIFGCGGSGVESKKYQNPALDTYSLETIAILPIRNSDLGQNEAKEIDRYFVTGISKKGVTFLSPEESIEKLIKDSLEEKYYKNLESYSITGIPNVETLKQIGVSLKWDAIYQGVIYDIIKIDGKFGEYSGETTATVKYSLFSTDDGKLLREASATAHKKNSTTLGQAPPLIEVVKMAMKKIIPDLLNSK